MKQYKIAAPVTGTKLGFELRQGPITEHGWTTPNRDIVSILRLVFG